MSRKRNRTPAYFYPLWEQYGEAITAGIGWKTLVKEHGFPERMAKSLTAMVKEEGPTPHRSGVRTILPIGDLHIAPGTSHFNGLMEDLARWVIFQDPDVLVLMGDVGDMPSLCKYDLGKKAFEGKRYLKDVAAVQDAMHLFHNVIRRYNESCGPYKTINPRLVFLPGNHENRIERAQEDAAQLDGLIGIQDFELEKRGYETHGFLEPVTIDGICFAHYHISGIMGRAISGVYPAANILKKRLVSCVGGHSHTFDYHTMTNATGKRLHGLVVGCVFEDILDYAHEANKMYWRGCCAMKDVADGDYDLETYSLARIRRDFGEDK